MRIEIEYSKKSLKFLAKNKNILTESQTDELIFLAIKKLKNQNVNINLKKLTAQNGAYRIRKGDIRIVFTIDENGEVMIISVEKIGFRGGVYKD